MTATAMIIGMISDGYWFWSGAAHKNAPIGRAVIGGFNGSDILDTVFFVPLIF